MGIIVIVAYKPKHGKEEALDLLMKSHVRRLRNEGLVTDRESVVCRVFNSPIKIDIWRYKGFAFNYI